MMQPHGSEVSNISYAQMNDDAQSLSNPRSVSVLRSEMSKSLRMMQQHAAVLGCLADKSLPLETLEKILSKSVQVYSQVIRQ